MAGFVTPNVTVAYVAKADPVFSFTLTSDGTTPVNLSTATLSGYLIALDGSSTNKLYGAFTVLNQTSYPGQATYQWTLIDVNVPGGFRLYISAKLSGEPFVREFSPVTVAILPTPEFWGGFYVQEVDLNVGGQPNTSSNPTYTDVIDRIARVLGHVIVDSMPAVTGTIAPQVGGVNVSTANPLPTTSGQVGLIAPYGSNGGTTGSAADYSFKWGAGGTTTVQRVIISNETGADVRYELDTTASANSLRLKDGNVLFIQQPCTVLHLFTASSQNVNQAGGVMVRGYN